MANVVTDVEAGVARHDLDESTSLLHVSLSQADIEIAKRDTRDPYFIVALSEFGWMASSSFWTALALLLQSLISFINVVSVGHLGTTELAAMTLSTTCYGVIALAPSIGMMGAMETFCSNAYTASRDKTMVGFHLQRGLLATFIHLVAAIPILINGESILLAIGQNPEVAHLSGQYLHIQILGIIPIVLFEAGKCFLQSQEIMSGGTTVLGFVIPIHAINNYLLVHSSYGIGYRGAAFATVTSCWLMLLGIIIYIRRSQAMTSWGGWDSKALNNMSVFYHLAIPATITICAEWFCFELLNIGSSYFGTKQLAATSITITTVIIAYQISNGIGYSTSPRIGNLIGAGKPRHARIARDMSLLVAASVGTTCLIFLKFCGKWWISVYTDDPEVIYEALKIMPIFCAFIVCDAINTVLSSIMRGLGRQKVSASSYIFSYYCIAAPLGIYLGYRKGMESVGLWWGISVAVIFSSVVQFVYAYKWVNWTDEVRHCLVRLHRSQGETNDIST